MSPPYDYIDKYILLAYPGDVNQGLFSPNARDNCTEPFILLKEELSNRGYDMRAINSKLLPDCGRLIFWDGSGVRYGTGVRGLYRRLKYGDRVRDWLSIGRRAGLSDRFVLILWEPPSVHAETWDLGGYNEFPVVLTWNDALVDGKRFHKFCLPVPAHVPAVEKIDFAKKKMLVNISYNKFSTYPNELYSARRDAIRYFEKKLPEDFDLYGVGWDRPEIRFGSGWQRFGLNCVSKPYTSYRGTIKHKWEVFPRYKFALCYESCSDQLGLITEKIFDCMRADCVPIYWGAPNVTDYVDPSAFVDRRQFRSNEELEEYLASINEKQYEQFREAIAAYLASEKFRQFLSYRWVDLVVNTLNLG